MILKLVRCKECDRYDTCPSRKDYEEVICADFIKLEYFKNASQKTEEEE